MSSSPTSGTDGFPRRLETCSPLWATSASRDRQRPTGGRDQSVIPALKNDGDILVLLDVLARDVGIIGIFSDWAGTVTYYANCMGL